MPCSYALLGGFAIGARFRCCDNIHVCKLIALYTANAYGAEREMSASACTHSMPGFTGLHLQSQSRLSPVKIERLGIAGHTLLVAQPIDSVMK